MHTVTWTIGIGEDRDGQAIVGDAADRMIDHARLMFASIYGGFTMVRGEGGWIDPSGRTVTEPCIVFTVHTDAAQDYRATARELRLIFRQDTVMLTVQSADVQSIDETA